MSKKKPSSVQGFSSGVTYEAPKVSEELFDSSGNYVAPASKPGGAGTLGTSIVN